MKQILQDLSSGETLIVDSPAPMLSSGSLKIVSNVSLISAGTERMLVEFAQSSYIDKARKQPEKVKMVLDKVATDGLVTTYDAVKSKLGQPIPLGYSNVGVVEEIGPGVSCFQVGDRVVSNGAHADIVTVKNNLCARIPDNVDDDSAVFTVVKYRDWFVIHDSPGKFLQCHVWSVVWAIHSKEPQTCGWQMI